MGQQDFPGAEIPRRAASVNSASVGFDGDPNSPAASASLRTMPAGTLYERTSLGQQWIKSSAAISGETINLKGAYISGAGNTVAWNVTEGTFLNAPLTGLAGTSEVVIDGDAPYDYVTDFPAVGSVVTGTLASKVRRNNPGL